MGLSEATAKVKVQMSALRKVLNEDRDIIKTVHGRGKTAHGRGYVFTGKITTTPVEAGAFPSPGSQSISPH